MSKKIPLALADLSDFSKENTLSKVAKKFNAKDFIITGEALDLINNVAVSYCIIISETLEEKAVVDLLNNQWKTATSPFKVFAWIPLNDMKEMVICNLEKNTEMRYRNLTLALEKMGAYKYIRNNTDMEFVGDIFKKVLKQKETA
jgi:hypothetical protein